MKIVIPLLSLENHGGTRDLIEVANYLSRKGHKVIFYAPYDRINTHYTIDDKVKIRKVPISGKKRWGQFKTLLWYIFNMEKADLYIANFFPTFYPIFIRNILKSEKFVYFIQDIEYKFVKFPLNIFALFTYILPSKKIALSHFIKQMIGDLDTEVALPGVSNIFLKMQPRERDFNKNSLIIGHIIRKERLKNSRLFLKALPGLIKRGYRILVVADKNTIKTLKDQYPDNLSGIVYTDSQTLCTEFYDKIDIFVHTSIVEGFGLPPLEAMARGCVVLLTDSGGVREYAEDKINTLFIDKAQFEDILKNIEILNNNRPLMQQISKNARDTALRFPMSNLGISFEKALHKLKLTL